MDTEPKGSIFWSMIKYAQFGFSDVKRVFVVSGGPQKKVDGCKLLRRAGLLKSYVKNEKKQMAALNVLQEMAAQTEQPGGDCLPFIHLHRHRFVHSNYYSVHLGSQHCIYIE